MSPKEETRLSGNNQSVIATSSSSLEGADSADSEEMPSSLKSQESLIPPSCHSFFYLSPDACEALPHFQYKGQDRSLLYAHVLSPLAQFCVDHFIPRWMAPNMITLIGLMFMVSSYAIMWYYDAASFWDAEESPSSSALPSWVFLWNAVCIFLYQTLDNIDGKQARRTGSSSPLGLLFDHGCDAVNSLFGSVGWIFCTQLRPRRDPLHCLVVLFGPYAMFYVSTWEEYYTGQLVMPLINGPNEGLLGAVLMSLTSFVRGPEFWQATSTWDDWLEPLLRSVGDSVPGVRALLPDQALRHVDLLMLAATFGFLQEVSQKIWSVARTYGAHTLASLMPFLTLVGSCIVVAYVDLGIWLQSPRTSLHLCATLFVEMATELMLKHTTHQRFRSLRWILAPLLLFTGAVAVGYVRATAEAHVLLVAYATACLVYLAMKTTLVVHEISALLDIWCFDIVRPRRPRGAPSMAHHRLSNGHTKVE